MPAISFFLRDRPHKIKNSHNLMILWYSKVQMGMGTENLVLTMQNRLFWKIDGVIQHYHHGSPGHPWDRTGSDPAGRDHPQGDEQANNPNGTHRRDVKWMAPPPYPIPPPPLHPGRHPEGSQSLVRACTMLWLPNEVQDFVTMCFPSCSKRHWMK